MNWCSLEGKSKVYIISYTLLFFICILQKILFMCTWISVCVCACAQSRMLGKYKTTKTRNPSMKVLFINISTTNRYPHIQYILCKRVCEGVCVCVERLTYFGRPGGWITRFRDRDHPGQHGETPSLLKI